MNDSNMKLCLSHVSSAAFAEMAQIGAVILLPLGSQEDHGPHLPMGDFRLAEILALRIAQAATRRGVPSFVAPALPFGVADYFGCSPGGLAISEQSFRGVLQDLLQGLLRHGLTRIVLLNGHGGNVPPIHDITLQIRLAGGPIIPSFYLWKVARQLMERRGVAAERFGHGAEPLLSLTSALSPDAVRAGNPAGTSAETLIGLPVSGFGTVSFEEVTIEVPTQFDQVPRDAIRTAWPQRSAALGQEIANLLVERASRFVVHFAKAANSSGVSKSRSTASVSTGTSATNSM